MLFVDGTFKTSPRTFYQLLNIISYIPGKELIIPIFTTAITSKTEKIYRYTLIEFQKIIDNLNIKVDFNKIKFMTDFEVNLIAAINKLYPILNYSDVIFIILKIHNENTNKHHEPTKHFLKTGMVKK